MNNTGWIITFKRYTSKLAIQYVIFSYGSSIWLKVMLKWELENLNASREVIFINFLKIKI